MVLLDKKKIKVNVTYKKFALTFLQVEQPYLNLTNTP